MQWMGSKKIYFFTSLVIWQAVITGMKCCFLALFWWQCRCFTTLICLSHNPLCWGFGYMLTLQNVLQGHSGYRCSTKGILGLYTWGPFYSWWHHQMETFSVLLALCAGNSPGTGEFLAQRPVMQCFDVFFDLWMIKRLSKQSWGWWFETPPHPLWHHCNVQRFNCDYDIDR